MHPSHLVGPRPLWLLVVSLAVLLLGAVGLSPLGGRVAAQGPEPQAPQVALGTGFTYQGQLKKNNTPVNDNNCSMTFSLWDLPSNGLKSGVDQVISPVVVANGLFTVVLNGVNAFGASAFTGQDRWLQTAVQCAGDVSPVTLSRQRLTAAPYALFSAAPWQTSGSTLFYNGGNVGIGASVPNNKLTVSGAADIASYLRVGGNSGGAGIAGDIVARRSATTGAYYFGDSINNYLYFDGTNYRFGQGELYVNTGGNVLIGTMLSDTAKLRVVTTGGDAVYATSSSGNGVSGTSTGGDGVSGTSTSGDGVSGLSASGTGVYGQVTGVGYAGYFFGNVRITGTCCAAAANYSQIDHPLDSANQYLNHSFVESPDMLNVYNGNVTTDEQGDATVVLPDWFEALNRDFRYQLTVLGKQWAQARVEEEIQNNQFRIKTDKPNVKVSWQVTGIRHDPWAEQHRIPVEEPKAAAERGQYLYPKEAGLPETLGIGYAKRHALAQGAPSR